MKFTLLRKKAKEGEVSLSTSDFQTFTESIKNDIRRDYITRYREIYNFLDNKEGWDNYWRIPKVCFTSELQTRGEKRCRFVAYNGVSVVIVDNLNGKQEAETIKRQSSLFPQVLAAFLGGDGHSVVILTVSSLPDGSLPQKEQEAKLFCAQAYATSVRSLTPSLSYDIHILPPLLDQTVLMPLDENPYINLHPAPYIIEQPKEGDLKGLLEQNDQENRLERLPATPETFVTFNELFNAAFLKAIQKVPGWQGCEASDEEFILVLAEQCQKGGIPEEEAFVRIKRHFHHISETELRGSVLIAYTETKTKGHPSRVMGRRQLVATQLPKFLDSRFEIRYNEVMQMTEFRRRRALHFMFKELSNRDINTIHHEACLAGINTSSNEVDELIHSNFVKKYNPIEDYLYNLPEWDGKDRITDVARMVPTSNPYWERLFYRWFLSVVFHWLTDDNMHANATAPILIGAQGYRKSTFCRQLLPPELSEYFTDSIDFRSDIEAERMLSRFLLVNIDEFDQLSEKQFAFVKHLFQKPATNIRRMYSETIGRQRRYASFIGTSNHQEILRDPTGNRRYICVEVTEPIHTEKSIEYSQLYAQAIHLINSGERCWLNDEDEALIREINEGFCIETPLESVLLSMFEVPEEGCGTWLRSTEIMDILSSSNSINKNDIGNLRRLGRILTKLKVKKERDMQGYKYYLKRI